MYLRKSPLMAWIQCPRKYKLMFVDKAEKQVPSVVIEGRMNHKVFCDFFDWIDKEHLKTLKNLTQAIEYFRTLMPPTDNLSIMKAMENFWRFEAYEWVSLRDVPDPLRYFIPVAREKVFIVKKREEGPFLGFAGHVDRIDRMLDENLIVIDYKPKIYNISSLRRELCFYQQLINDSHVYDRRVTHWGCFEYRIGKTFYESSNPRTKAAIDKQISRMKKSILENNYPMKISDHCVNCWFNYICVEEMPNETFEQQKTSE